MDPKRAIAKLATYAQSTAADRRILAHDVQLRPLVAVAGKHALHFTTNAELLAEPSLHGDHRQQPDRGDHLLRVRDLDGFALLVAESLDFTTRNPGRWIATGAPWARLDG